MINLSVIDWMGIMAMSIMFVGLIMVELTVIIGYWKECNLMKRMYSLPESNYYNNKRKEVRHGDNI